MPPVEILPHGFVPAYLKIDNGDEVECYFNPTEYSIAKTNTWEPHKGQRADHPPSRSSAAASRARWS